MLTHCLCPPRQSCVVDGSSGDDLREMDMMDIDDIDTEYDPHDVAVVTENELSQHTVRIPHFIP
jgi:hypothetical protein